MNLLKVIKEKEGIVGFAMFVMLLLFLSYSILFKENSLALLKSFDLVIHEAGHVVFMLFGETIMLMGGSMLQIIVPIVFFFSFFMTMQKYASSFALWWIGENLINVSIYISDAQERSLQLITNDPNTHDWWQLFTKWEVLEYDNLIGGIVYFTGVLFLIASIALITFLFFGDSEKVVWKKYRLVKN